MTTAKLGTIESLFKKLYPKGSGSFSARSLAASLGIETWQATALIQMYLREQRANTSTIYWLYRTGRTRGTVWHIGLRKADARARLRQYSDDAKTTWRTVERDLIRFAALEPTLAKECQTLISITAGAMTMMDATINTVAAK